MSSVVRQHCPPDDRPCLCQICICGKHNCPGVAQMTPLGAQSSYRDHYTAKPNGVDRSVPIRQAQQLTTSKAAPGHFTTTNQAAFDPINGSPRDRSVSFKPKPTDTQPTPFAGNSSYQSDFPVHPLDQAGRSKAPREALQRAPAAPGAFETTNQVANSAILQALRDGTVSRNLPAKNRDGSSLSKTPFEGTSSYLEQYRGHTPDTTTPRRRGDPSGFVRNSADNRDFLTTNGAAFQKPPQDRGPVCPSTYCNARRPPSRDGHIKLEEVPDSHGNLSPAREWSARRLRQ